MAVLDPAGLLDQSEALLVRSRGGAAHEVDLRRAISAAYYSLFHLVAAAAADLVVGHARRAAPRYNLVYRGLDHRTLSNLCTTTSRPSLPPKYRDCCPDGGFGSDIRAFSGAVRDLQQQRHLADYDPGLVVSESDASAWIDIARGAIGRWNGAAADEREAFLLLLLFPPR